MVAPCKNTGTFSLGSRETTENPIINFLKVGADSLEKFIFLMWEENSQLGKTNIVVLGKDTLHKQTKRRQNTGPAGQFHSSSTRPTSNYKVKVVCETESPEKLDCYFCKLMCCRPLI